MTKRQADHVQQNRRQNECQKIAIAMKNNLRREQRNNISS